MAMGMAGLTLGSGAKHGGNVVVAFHVGLLGEIQIAAVGLRLAGERGLQVVFRLASLKRSHTHSFQASVVMDKPSHCANFPPATCARLPNGVTLIQMPSR